MCTPTEMMILRAAGELRDQEVVFVGIGLPNLACNLARRTHAPGLFLIYESGAVGAVPERVPVSIGDPALVTGSLAAMNQKDVFALFLQGGLIEVGFLGGSQIDRWGNLNTTVIGKYRDPAVRLPGSGGACEIAAHSQRLLVMMPMTRRSFVERCDFVTSPGHRFESRTAAAGLGRTRSQLGLAGPGPEAVITDLGVCRFEEGEMTLSELYPGVELETAREACSWPLRVSLNLATSPQPEPGMIELLRELDPRKLG